jgi:hypothetical protein
MRGVAQGPVGEDTQAEGGDGGGGGGDEQGGGQGGQTRKSDAE